MKRLFDTEKGGQQEDTNSWVSPRCPSFGGPALVTKKTCLNHMFQQKKRKSPRDEAGAGYIDICIHIIMYVYIYLFECTYVFASMMNKYVYIYIYEYLLYIHMSIFVSLSKSLSLSIHVARPIVSVYQSI